MERDGLCGARPPRSERARWVSAVLIVTAIGATTAAVFFWPVRHVLPAAPAVVVLPAARALPIPAAAPGLVPAPPPIRHAPPRVLTSAVAPVPHVAAPVPVAPRPVPQVPSVPREVVADTAAPEVPLLASRRLDLPDTPPTVAAAPPAGEDSDSFYEFVEIPAVAVTRAVAVAGRGIRTGLRATSAVFKAAF